MNSSITIALDWAANPNHTGLFLAMSRGYFSQSGIEVRVLPSERDRSVTELLRSGEADLAYAFAGTVIAGRDEGEDFVGVAAVMPAHHSSLAVLASSDITRPADFQGKRYASFGQTQLERAVVATMMRHDGAQSAAFVLDTVRFASVDTLIDGQADFLWIYNDIEGIEARYHGRNLRLFSPADYGIPNYYAPLIFTRERLLADTEKRDMARRCLQALRRGYEDAAANPESAVVDFQQQVAALERGLFTDSDLLLMSQRAQSNHYLSAIPGHRWGYQERADWEAFASFLFAEGAIEHVLDIDALFTNSLLEV
jgi:ABC-type nitrate/sulfonate/bicarbonate transport system substrate-binding protein